MVMTWEDVECTEALNTAERAVKTTLTLRSGARYRYCYTPPDGMNLRDAIMHMEAHCCAHPLANPKIRGPLKVIERLFVGAIHIRATRHIRLLRFGAAAR